jgi:hypothetical protein
VTIDDLVAKADYDTTYELGPCRVCGAETWCGARIPLSDALWSGKRFIHLCFRLHRNPKGLRIVLEKEVKQ